MEAMGNRWQLLWEEQQLCVWGSFFCCSSSLGQRKKMTKIQLIITKQSLFIYIL